MHNIDNNKDNEKNILDQLSAQIGELAQHQLSHDEKIEETSNWYYGFLTAVLNRNPGPKKRTPPRYFEIACYRHVLGYKLAQDFGFESTHFDISDRDLEIGLNTALELGLQDTVERVAGDFHDLPFSDNYFDLVMISASLHHTRTPERIIQEVMRVLTDGGLFYSQREPCERLFCFYQFNANRPEQHTAFEAHLQKRDIMLLISSPFPGARNAEMFGRVENDHIPLELYYAEFERYGKVVEQALYCDGLLTAMDKKILAHTDLPELKLSAYIRQLIIDEIELAMPLLSQQDRLLGYSLPTETEIVSISEKTASALKSRPLNPNSIEWQKAMVKIFGGSLRFVVERHRNEKVRNTNKYRRSCTIANKVILDDQVYKHSGLNFWDNLLPDIQTTHEDDLKQIFSDDHWLRTEHKSGVIVMISKSAMPIVIVNPGKAALAVIRYRTVVDSRLSAARLHITYDGKLVGDELIAQTEDRMLRFLADPTEKKLAFSLFDLEGNPYPATSRIRISIFQCVPIKENG